MTQIMKVVIRQVSLPPVLPVCKFQALSPETVLTYQSECSLDLLLGAFGKLQTATLNDFWLPPRYKCDLRYSRSLRSVKW